MKVTLTAARVYGSGSHYADGPRIDPLGGPVQIQHFPADGERSYVQIGAPVSWMPHANRIGQAIGVVALTAFTNPATGSKGEDAVRELLDSDEILAWAAEDYAWYISLVIERDIELEQEDLADNRYLWITPSKVVELEREFVSYATQYLDMLVAYGTTVLEPMFFEKVIVNDKVFFRSPLREIFRLPHFTAHGGGTIVRQGGSTDFEAIRARFESLSGLSQQRHDWLQKVAHWHAASLVETDRLKRFLWTFFALEILIHKVSKQLHSLVVSDLRYGSSAYKNIEAIKHLVGEYNRLPLTGRFVLMALVLSPDSADQDTEQFQELKRSRDSLAHGDSQSIDMLPVNEAKKLLERYLRLETERQLLETE